VPCLDSGTHGSCCLLDEVPAIKTKIDPWLVVHACSFATATPGIMRPRHLKARGAGTASRNAKMASRERKPLRMSIRLLSGAVFMNG
jgi:hypothetical protein